VHLEFWLIRARGVFVCLWHEWRSKERSGRVTSVLRKFRGALNDCQSNLIHPVSYYLWFTFLTFPFVIFLVLDATVSI
jgi:hypothetical protein